MAGHDPALRPEQCWYSAWPHSGGLQGIGSHAIDQCRFLVGEIASVSALVRTFNRPRAIPSAGDSAASADEGTAAVLEFADGAIGVMESSVVATGRKNFLSWEINGSKGSLRWDLEHPNSLYACLEQQGGSKLLGFSEISVTESDHPYVGPWWPHGHNLGWEHCQIIEKFHFLDAVAHDRPLDPHQATFEDGYRVAVIIDAMRNSSAVGPEGTGVLLSPAGSERVPASGVFVLWAICCLPTPAWAEQAEGKPMNTVAIEKDRFGATADGVAVDRYTLRNSGGMTVRLITYGATVTELLVPGRNGEPAGTSRWVSITWRSTRRRAPTSAARPAGSRFASPRGSSLSTASPTA